MSATLTEHNVAELVGAFTAQKRALSVDTPVWERVYTMVCTRHTKAGSPDSMHVTYFINGMLGETVSEWVCFEHTGYARERATIWSLNYGVYPPPDTVAEALEVAWPIPMYIQVSYMGEYPRVRQYRFREVVK